jgi:hypothetical protein
VRQRKEAGSGALRPDFLITFKKKQQEKRMRQDLERPGKMSSLLSRGSSKEKRRNHDSELPGEISL